MSTKPSRAWVSICRSQGSITNSIQYISQICVAWTLRWVGRSKLQFLVMPNIAFGNMRRPSAREGWGRVSWRRVLLWFTFPCHKNGVRTISMWRWPQKHKLQGMKLLYRQSLWHIFSGGGGHYLCQILCMAKEAWRKMMEEARLHVYHVRCTLSLRLFVTTSCVQAVSLSFTDCNAIVLIHARPPRTSWTLTRSRSKLFFHLCM